MTFDPGISAAFPQIDTPFVDPRTGKIQQTWIQLLISLFNRTGAGTGNDSSDLGEQVAALEAQLGSVFGLGEGLANIRSAVQGLAILSALSQAKGPAPSLGPLQQLIALASVQHQPKGPDFVPAVTSPAKGPDWTPPAAIPQTHPDWIPPTPGLTWQVGQWTPVPAFATPGTSSFSALSQTGWRFNIGPFVYIGFSLTFTPTLGTAAGALEITGVPIPSYGPADVAAGAIGSLTSTFIGYSGALSLAFAGPTALQVLFVSAGADSTALTVDNVTGGSAHTITGSIAYIAL